MVNHTVDRWGIKNFKKVCCGIGRELQFAWALLLGGIIYIIIEKPSVNIILPINRIDTIPTKKQSLFVSN